MFNIKVKGHPLSELSRSISSISKEPESPESLSRSLKQESLKKSRFYVLTPKGMLTPVDRFDFKQYPNLKKFINYEQFGVRSSLEQAPHIKLMRSHEIADYEPGSDSGNMRWYPNGTLIKRLLEQEILDFSRNNGAMEVETPVMYDYNHPALKKYLDRFPARHYIVNSDNKKFFLRFAACFGMFLIAHDMTISYKSLPMKMIENTRYSFRREQTGELSGLKRLRAFTMPDMHTFCTDIASAKNEFEAQFNSSMEFLNICGVNDYEAGFRVEQEFYDKHEKWYKKMVKQFGRPVLLEIFDIRYAYFITKFEFNFIDAMDKASALSTVQIDVENADTYDISYVAKDGARKRPLILHTSLPGAVERIIYTLLEQAYMQGQAHKQAKPMLPLWLCPSQVRVIPVGAEHVAYCRKLTKTLCSKKIRADIDDRDKSMGKKIRDAEKQWIPYIIVAGDKEVNKTKVSVKVRCKANGTNKNDKSKNIEGNGNNNVKQMTLAQLVKEIHGKTKAMPFMQMSVPAELSKRPIFVGTK